MFDLKSLTFTEKTFDTSLFLYETGDKRHDGQDDFFSYFTDCFSLYADIPPPPNPLPVSVPYFI